MASPEPNVDDLYVVLRACAVAKKYKTYTELSQTYQARTGDWFEPHGSWDGPLGELNNRLHATSGAPALSSIVVKKDTKEPGRNFWGSAPNVPPCPKGDVARIAAWSEIVKQVFAWDWPPSLP